MKLQTAMIVGLAAVLGTGPLSSVHSDPFTLCVREQNGKLNRGAFGEVPAKGGCKNNKWSEVTLVQESNLNDLDAELQGQIDVLDSRVDALETKTTANMDAIIVNDGEIAALQTKTEANMTAIDANGLAIEENSLAITELDATVSQIVTSSMIGGDMDFFQQLGAGSETAWLGMFRSNVFTLEEEATQNLSAGGTITNIFVRSSEPGENNSLTLTLRIAETDTVLTCSITGTERSCAVPDACVPVAAGQLISVRVDYEELGAPTSIFDIRWNSRFVENGVCDG